MLQQLISHNPDLKKLIDNGYNIELCGGQYLLVHQIPYVNNQKELKEGILVCILTLASPSRLGKPKDHTIFFCGDTPCDFKGNPLTSIINNSNTKKLSNEITINHYFSSKPNGGYANYFDKIHTYATILKSQVNAISNN